MTHHDKASKSNKNSSRMARWPYFLAAGAVLVVGATLAVPSLLSSPGGRDWLLSYVNQELSGRVSVRDISLSWFGQQRFEGIEVTDPEGRVVASLDIVTTDASPLQLLRNNEIGNVEIVGARVNLVQDSRGVSNLHQALVPAVVTASAVAQPVKREGFLDELALSVPTNGSVSIRDATITLTGPLLRPMSFEHVSALFRSDLNNGIAEAVVKGLSHQEDLSGRFAVNISFSGLDKQGRMALKPNAAGIPLPQGDGEIRAKFDVDNVAVNIVDQLVTINNPSVTGLLAEAVGSTLDIRLDGTLNRTGPALEIAATSDNFHADLITRLQDGKLVLERPGNVTLRVTPDLFARFSRVMQPHQQPLFALARNVDIGLEFERMSLPTQLIEGTTAQPTLRMHLSVDDATLIGNPAIGQVTLHAVSGSLERLEASNSYVFTASAAIEQGELGGLVRLGGKVQEHPQSEQLIGSDILLSASNIPSVLLDYLWEGDGLLTDVIGPDLDFQAKLAWDESGTKVELRAGSDFISAPSLQLAWGDRVILEKPTQVRLQVTPRLVEYLGGEHPVLALEDRIDALVSIDRLSLLTGRTGWLDGLIVDAKATTTPFILNGRVGDVSGSARFSNVKLATQATGPARTYFKLSGDIAPDGVTPLFTATLGSASSFDIGGLWSMHHQLEEAQLNLQSDRFDARISMRSTEEGRLALASPAVIRYVIKPDTLLAYGLLQPGNPYLTQKTPIEIRVEEFSWDPWAPLATSFETKGRLFTNAIQVAGVGSEALASLNDGSIDWNISGSTHMASLSLQAKTTQGTQQGLVIADLKATRWHEPLKGRAQGKLSLESVPTALLVAMTGSPAWSTLFGTQIDGLAAGHYDYQTPGQLDILFRADQLDLEGKFALGTSEAFLQATDPLQLAWTITPARLNALEQLGQYVGLNRPLPMTLAKPTHLVASFSSVVLPWQHSVGVVEPQQRTLGWGSPSFKGSVELDGLDLTDKTNSSSLAFETIALQLETAKLSDTLDFNLKLAERPNTDKPAKLHVQGALTSLGTNQIGIDVALEGEELPLKSLLRYPLRGSKVREELPVLIGDRVGGIASFRLAQGNGHVRADLSGATGHFSLDGEIDSQVLTFTRPLTLELAITPYLRKNILQEVAPYMAAAISTERSIRLTVDNRGFSYPLASDSLTDVRISNASLELGKVTFDSNGTLGSVISLLNAPSEPLANTFQVWFTPLTFSLNEGILRLNRIDALVANRYPIAMWGKVDLIKDRVRMTLGIPGEALRESYAITQLADNYMLQIPFTGTTDNASIDKTRAAARITALVAQNHGSREGVVIGGVLDLLSGGRDEAVPPPTGPIPWATEKRTSQIAEEEPGVSAETETESKQPHEKIKNKIRKGASRLLDVLR